ncbi:conserved Plasmodium protein, unknown function [Plasmodium berghei]|uniref:Uncharacterized protein n=2 Tax=Plasmodium berghei TaxID=5821 RepID=A0A509AZK5_PLABA|nr:conserved protein, unknown function [Plasmodium berghei ANKA]CXJ14754.1 conserved Plasmodium protein, unknown function [Plasmodium berghei]SCM26211.1 conserved Plasmodium protein, unknown function [Plasmodium berghei]SCN28335.1 conserved Plasmodium protein, unknown function [Plasmodium berghei]SCO62533.1 conserved Plasmodium protein, unknown function [Plasmodium berghei]SCO64091.1 conserved Plasmodium protein, unknown function [Plasmodium berghei]|eukprot:XP_034423987.1 conserved protein, unknown function [Plasmodium berghei ANKA]
MGSSKCLSTRVTSFILYLIPLIYSALIILFGTVEYKNNNPCNLVFLCMFYGVVIIVICLVGCWGVIKENATSVRSTLILLIVNNIIMSMLITFLLIDTLKYPHIAIIHKASKLLQFIVEEKKVGLIFCSVIYALIFFSFCFMWNVGDYLAQLDANMCLDDIKNSHDRIQNNKKKYSKKISKDESEFLIKV